MKKLELNLITGDIKINSNSLDKSKMLEKEFVNSDFYHNAIKENWLKKTGIHQYTINDLSWMDKPFLAEINPVVGSSMSFNIYLINKTGRYYDSLGNWDKLTNIDMLNKEIEREREWLNGILKNYNDTLIIPNGFRWLFPWGHISVQYEVRSFSCGIYLSWNK